MTLDDSSNESSEDDAGFAMVVESNVRPSENYPYEVLSTEEIIQMMADCIHEVNIIFEDIPATTIKTLLSHFKWDRDRLVEELFEGDRNHLFADAKVVNPEKWPPDPGVGESGVCDSCYCEHSNSKVTGLGCGHRFCTMCWEEYLTTEIIETPRQAISCPADLCDILVDDVTVMNFVSDPDIRLMHQHQATNYFVECNKLLRWCPFPGCTNAIKVNYVEARPVTCKCSHVFCFACGESWHAPVKCNLLKKWIRICDNAESSDWIAANTKECPECSATIEKYGGCNHITSRAVCKNQNCPAEFCWVCLKPWDPQRPSWFTCNRYDDVDDRAASDVSEKTSAALQRYLFYCNRYMSHKQSLNFELELKASLKIIQGKPSHQLLKRSIDMLCQCRQTLMYSFAFAYYLGKNNQSTIFEYNLRDLERATEALSQFLERDINTVDNLGDIKQTVQNKCRYCESRRKALLDHVSEGYEKDWWIYNED